jgi:hypothetical protein
MLIAPVILLVAGLSQYPTIMTPDQVECYDYDLFSDVLDRGGAKLTQTIETPSFPTFKRLMVVTYKGTKQVFAPMPTVLSCRRCSSTIPTAWTVYR